MHEADAIRGMVCGAHCPQTASVWPWAKDTCGALSHEVVFYRMASGRAA